MPVNAAVLADVGSSPNIPMSSFDNGEGRPCGRPCLFDCLDYDRGGFRGLDRPLCLDVLEEVCFGFFVRESREASFFVGCTPGDLFREAVELRVVSGDKPGFRGSSTTAPTGNKTLCGLAEGDFFCEVGVLDEGEQVGDSGFLGFDSHFSLLSCGGVGAGLSLPGTPLWQPARACEYGPHRCVSIIPNLTLAFGSSSLI